MTICYLQLVELKRRASSTVQDLHNKSSYIGILGIGSPDSGGSQRSVHLLKNRPTVALGLIIYNKESLGAYILSDINIACYSLLLLKINIAD